MNHVRTITRLGFAALACAPLSVALGEGSELPDGSVTITSLPFFDTGDTSDNLDDFDAVCPFKSDSPDVFYTITFDVGFGPCGGPPPAIRVTLCESSYDTKVYVLDSAFNEIACNDDFCTSSGGGQFRSFIDCAPIAGAGTYYIAIDGWSGDAGVYDVIVETCSPHSVCIFDAEDCPDGALPEGEPCDEGTRPDSFNGGCNAPGDPVFTAIACGDMICGTTAQGDTTRDTDWYELNVAEPTLVEMSAVGENAIVFGRIAEGSCAPGAPECGCIAGTIDPFATPAACECLAITDVAVPGGSWWFVSTVAAGAVPCGGEEPGNDYIVSWGCSAAPCCTLGDANADGTVDFNDLVILLANWGPCSD